MICLSQAKLSGKSHHFVDVVHEYALHSRSWRCVPFGQHQELRPLGGSNFRTMRKVIISYSRPIRLSDFTLSIRRVIGSLGIADFWCWTFPEVAIPGADRNERGLWERECTGA